MKGGNRHYTASGLIQRLEELEIGRPSTYALFVDTLLERGYIKCKDVPGTERSCLEYRLTADTNRWVEQETMKKFGEEKNKLVLQPAGTLCVEFLMKHFHTFFDYSYTKKMEESLDFISDNKLAEDISWKTLCTNTYMDLVGLLNQVAENETKRTVRLDEHHEVIFQKHGPVVRKQVETGYEYLPFKESFTWNMEELKQGTYSLDDLVEYPSSYLGDHEGKRMNLHKGPYGLYVQWGDVRKSVKEKISTLEQAISFLEAPKEPTTTSSNIMRVIDQYTSVRRGKYGPYLYHKKGNMKQPTFVTLKKFTGDYLSCDPVELFALLK